MKYDSLLALSPIDGRYASRSEALRPFFSEYGLMHYRLQVEVEYFIALSEQGLFSLDEASKEFLRQIYETFDIDDARKIKEIEKTTNHDVKAVEYFLKDKLKKGSQGGLQEWVHFGLTSQDVNNTAQPMALRDAVQEVYAPCLGDVISMLRKSAQEWKNIPMLARTHGQPASPSTIGKEIMVFVERLQKQYDSILQHRFEGKFGGATGNFNAHYVAYPDIDWPTFADQFVGKKLKLHRQQTTTQIDHYDHYASLFDNMRRVHIILIDLCRDVWQYISMDFFGQEIKKGEVGSSAMPHKVNPIDFENAEGNLLVANAMLDFMSNKLPISRLQRDLTDSTVLRNTGVPFAHAQIAMNSIIQGWGKLKLRSDVMAEELAQQWIILAEAIQTVLRKEQVPGAYEKLKDLSRGKSKLDPEEVRSFIQSLEINPQEKEKLLALTPDSYIGNAGQPS